MEVKRKAIRWKRGRKPNHREALEPKKIVLGMAFADFYGAKKKKKKTYANFETG